MAHDDDLPEYTSSGQKIKADPPKGGAVPPIAVYNPPAKGEAHPKIARKSVAQRLDVAEAAVTAAQLELNASYNALRQAEREEAAAHGDLIRLLPAPSPEEVNRKRLAAEQAAKQKRADEGKSPVAKMAPSHGRSPVDIAAANRPRTSPQAASHPLRSPVSRRGQI
jgi:hypothetical protein